MKKPTVAELLTTYGITDYKTLHQVIKAVKDPPYTQEYARKLYTEIVPMTRKVAVAIRDYTGGRLTLDALMAENGH